jgi:hypothetical protein
LVSTDYSAKPAGGLDNSSQKKHALPRLNDVRDVHPEVLAARFDPSMRVRVTTFVFLHKLAALAYGIKLINLKMIVIPLSRKTEAHSESRAEALPPLESVPFPTLFRAEGPYSSMDSGINIPFKTAIFQVIHVVETLDHPFVVGHHDYRRLIFLGDSL